MEKLQFSAILMLTLLTLQITLLMPSRVAKNPTINRSRWYLVTGIILLALQFLLQFIFGFRAIGITQAAMINLLFFIPCTSLFNLTMLNLQQQGHIERKTWAVAIGTTVITWALLGGTVLIDGEALLSDSPMLRKAEYISGIIYSFMQIYYVYLLYRNDQRLRRVLDNYYDYTSRRVLLWMRRVAFMLTLLVLGVPFLIFSSGIVLKIYSATIFLTIFYLVTAFAFYCVSNDANQVMVAEQTNDVASEEGEKTMPDISDEDKQRIAKKVEKWVANGGYLQSGLTIQKVADEMQLPRHQLATWLKTTEWELFNPWMTYLRIEEAKRVLKEHEDWSNDAVARQCGFASRIYFQQVFKKSTGMTPAQFAEKSREG